MIKRSFKDVIRFIKATGAIYEYTSKDGITHYSNTPFTEEEKKKYDNTTKNNLDIIVNHLRKEIDKRINKRYL